MPSRAVGPPAQVARQGTYQEGRAVYGSAHGGQNGAPLGCRGGCGSSVNICRLANVL